MFALIGGHINRIEVKNKIERHLIELTKKECPNILFCPLASKDAISSINKFKRQMGNLNYNLSILDFNSIDKFDELLASADIFYIGGGVSDDLINIFKEKGLDKVLYNHLNDDKVFAGSSAGAMLYTYASMGDKYMFYDNFHHYNYKMVNCLNFLNITICPHYQNEDLVIYNDELKKYKMDAFGIEEDTMVVIDNNSFYCIKEEGKLGVYYFSYDDNYLMIPLKEGKVYEKVCGFRSKGDLL